MTHKRGPAWHDPGVPRNDRDSTLADHGGAMKDRGTISDTGDVAPGEPAFADTQPALASADLTGTTIDRYRVLGRIGAGGMGVVYAAFDPALDRKVALKMLPQVTVEHHAALEARSRLEARLRREAQALAKLDHPNVIGVFDVGFTEDNVFVTMQLVEGTTLDDYIQTTKPSPRQMLELFAAAGRGLAAAHEAGLVHRDVKPSNILVDRTGHAYIGDFGLARSADEIDPASSMPRSLLYDQMTRMGAVLGTPRYMSPEQLGGEPATSRSDQFSFCVSVWEALFGEHPFVAGKWTPEGAITAMAADEVREPGSRSVPARTVRALVRGMRCDAASRWPSMVELVDEIAPRSKAGWVYGGGALLGMAVAVLLTAVLMREPDRKAGCANEADAVLVVWPAHQADVIAKFHDDRLTGVLADYADRWQRMRVETCQTSDGPAHTSAVQCLDADLRIFGEIVDELVASKPGFADKVAAVLPRLEDCSSVAQAALPPIPEHAVAKVAEIRLQIARVYRSRAGRDLPLANKLVETAVEDSRTLGYQPMLAEALVAKADLQLLTGDPAVRATASEAAEIAATVHADRVASRAYAISLLDAVNRPDMSRLETLLPVARATAIRTGDPTGLADFDHAASWGYRALGRYDDAESACRDALEQAGKLDEYRRDAIRDDAYGCYAETYAQRGNGREAMKWVDKWIELVEKRFGNGRLGTLQALRAKVTVLQLLHDHEAAISLNQRVLAITNVTYGGDHVTMLDDLFVHVRLLRSAGRVPGAMTAARRALALVNASQKTDVRTRVLAEETLGEVLGMSGDRKGMFEHYETALAIAEGSLTSDDDHLATLRYSFGLALFHDDDNLNLDRADDLFGKAKLAWQHLRSPKQYYAEVEHAMLRAQQHRCSEAMPMYSHVIAGAQPGVQRMKAQLGLGDCLAEAGDLTRAKELFATVAREGPALPGGDELAKIASAWLAEH
jgi:tetratricopeptide (TPR) repeat protein